MVSALQVWCSVAQATCVGSDSRGLYGGLKGPAHLDVSCAVLCRAAKPTNVEAQAPQCQLGPLAVSIGLPAGIRHVRVLAVGLLVRWRCPSLSAVAAAAVGGKRLDAIASPL